ncbi:DUF6069 family protein [Micromonospora sp. CA-259024]|uniref:DUF6069 family protein n=1 Tax=Micromonospora sp. CA-259024 TaxID=3239965 RepID=UPI003D92143C
MRTLALRGGARVAVVAEEWCDAFGVVTRGRVQRELRDGAPGPVLGHDAGFWLRGTGVRSLVPPLLSGATTATTTALLGPHLVPATAMIPALAWSLRTRTD